MPTSTDLVTDLPADFEVFGQAVDTSMADLKGGTTGQILSKATSADMDFTWITNDVGDITEVTAGTGISGGGTSGAVTITNSMATAIDAKGDLIAGTGADTFSRLAIGTNNQVLTADSTAATGMKWATPAASGGDVVRIVTQSFTTSSTINLDDCFSSTYDNYKIFFNVNSTATGTDLRIRFRTGGTTNSSASYGSGWTYTGFPGGSVGQKGTVQGSTTIYFQDVSSEPCSTQMEIINPFGAFRTNATWLGVQGNDYAVNGGGQFEGSTSFDGISFILGSGTITGTVSVYGYKKA